MVTVNGLLFSVVIALFFALSVSVGIRGIERKAVLKNTVDDINLSLCLLWQKFIKILNNEGSGELNRRVGRVTKDSPLRTSLGSRDFLHNIHTEVIPLLEKNSEFIMGKQSRYNLLGDIAKSTKVINRLLWEADDKEINDLPNLCREINVALVGLNSQIEAIDEIFGKSKAS